MSRYYVSSPLTFVVDNVNGADMPCSGAFRTIQYAIDWACQTSDFAAQPTFKLVATGVPYDEAVVLPRWVGSVGWKNGVYSYPRIQGDTTNNKAVVIKPSAGWAFTGVNCLPWVLDSITVSSNDAGGINSDACSHILGRNINFGPVSTAANCAQVLAQHGGFYEHIDTGFTISGGGWCHAYAHLGGIVKLQGPALVALENNPLFTYRFAISDGNSILDYSGVSWSGMLANGIYVQPQVSSGGFMSPASTAPPWP